MEQTLDQVRKELADIHDELLALPIDAFSQRSDLRVRQNELRQLSHRLVEEVSPTDPNILKAAFDRLHTVRDQLLDRHLTYSSTSGGDAGIEADFTMTVNKAMDTGLGLDEIESQLAAIIRQLRSAD